MALQNKIYSGFAKIFSYLVAGSYPGNL